MKTTKKLEIKLDFSAQFNIIHMLNNRKRNVIIIMKNHVLTLLFIT
jgi:hypothetical protein